MSVFDRTDGAQTGLGLVALTVAGVVPLCGIVGAGWEYAQAAFLRSHLQIVAEAAAFEASRAPSRTEAEQRIAGLFPAGASHRRAAVAILEDWTPGAAHVSIRAEIPTRVMAALGNPSIPVGVRASATQGVPAAEPPSTSAALVPAAR